MPVEASFPEPLVVESLSGVHKHTIILLHGRGGSADSFGPVLLNTSILATARLADPVGGGQAAGRGNKQTVTTPDLLPTVEDTFVESPAPEPHSFGGAPEGGPSNGTPRSWDHHARNRQRETRITLAEALPHAKFVFPNAPKQRATVYKRTVMRQWFDDWHLRPELSGDFVNHRYDEGLQTSGFGDTVRYLHDLVSKEADLVGGVGSVVLGGISQGCAASLVAALLWEGDGRLGAVVGMCGWLPYLAQMKEAIQTQGDSLGFTGDDDVFEVFERPTCPVASHSITNTDDAAVSWLRDELDLPGIQSSRPHSTESFKAPVILCHGDDDKIVDRDQSQATAEFLLSLGIEGLHWKLYGGVGHEYSKEMLGDILALLESVLSIDTVTV